MTPRVLEQPGSIANRRAHPLVHPGATLRADDPVNGRFNLVEHQGRLPGLNERLLEAVADGATSL